MRHSIRFRLPVLFLALFGCFIATFLLSLMLFFRNDLRYDITRETQRYQDSVSELARQASNYGDEKALTAFLAGKAARQKIQLYDMQDSLIWSTGHVPTVLEVSASDYIFSGGVARYRLRVSGSFATRSELFGKYTARYLWVILLLFALLFFLMALFTHLSITRPVLALYRRMEHDPLRQKARAAAYRKDEIGALEKRFDRMLDRLQAQDREQQTMLAAVSHDLKTPLTSILTYAERLFSGKVADAEKRRHYYAVIHRKAEDIHALIDHFQDAAEAAALDRTLRLETVPAAPFLHALCDGFAAEWNPKEAALEWQSTLANDILIRVERRSTERVLGNLLENARKYGGHPLRVRVSLAAPADVLRLRVENNGAQVPDAALPLLFDRFYRAEPSRSRERGGSGLGLFICREIVEKHGGEIRAYKPWDMDFGVEICLPLAKS